MTNTYIGFRLSGSDLALLDAVVAKRNFGRSEAIRAALSIGLPLLEAGHSFNLKRSLLLLEYIQAGMDLIITREHSDFADKLPLIAQERMDTYHA